MEKLNLNRLILIKNIKNKDKKCFLSCHVRHINPLNEHPERIKTTGKKIAEKPDYDEIEFPVKEKDFNKIEIKNNICINVLSYENNEMVNAIPNGLEKYITFFLNKNLVFIDSMQCY